MTIIDTLKKWVNVELDLSKIDKNSLSSQARYIIRWYFFGSCDACTQAMELGDNDFLSLYREILKYIGISNEEIEESVGVWMLDEIGNNELEIINKGAYSFRDFKDNPNGVGGLKFCFDQFLSNNKN